MTDVDSLQAWLAVEHEAVWVYSLIGGRRDDLSDAARDGWNRHRDIRDDLTAWIRAEGGEPDGPRLGYPVADVSSNDAARSAAQASESKTMAAAMAHLPDPRRRARTLATLRAAATAAAEWGAAPMAFPGLDA
jgi:hypothetical protein